MTHSRIFHHLKEHATTIIFVSALLFDFIVLPDAGHALTRYLGYTYLFIVALFIFIREWVISRNRATKFENKIHGWLSFGIAYFSGAALSFVLVYAVRGADVSASWPLFAILFISILINEVVSAHSFRLLLDIGVLFMATLFFTVFNAPFYFGVQNDATFAASVAITMVVSLVYIYILKNVSETTEHETPKFISLALGIPMFIGMFYFLNAIPAVPLSLKDAGVYHRVVRIEGGEFLAVTEERGRFAFFQEIFSSHEHILLPSDDGVYFYSSVSAPAKITAPISHVWEYYDETTKRWVESTVVSFDLTGGREDGYRSYSKKENILEGTWRVTIKVDKKRVVGRRTFTIIKRDTAEPLKETKL
ncbi:MAG: hypothetical protein QG653_376 [Patescibacteria group bacterium]|nr:hypothetical protein [Patescibacteria group bacterium]